MKADAKALIDVMAGNDCMSGFHAQLQIALASVETATWPIRPNYRNVKVLRSLIDLCGEVMKVVEEADIRCGCGDAPIRTPCRQRVAIDAGTVGLEPWWR